MGKEGTRSELKLPRLGKTSRPLFAGKGKPAARARDSFGIGGEA